MKIRFTNPPQQANEQNGVPVRYAAAKRQLPRLRWYLLLLLVSAPLVYLAVRILIGVLWDSSPGFVAMPQSTLKATQSGQMEWLVQPGELVAAGALLARIGPPSNAPLALPPAQETLSTRQRLEAPNQQGRQQLSQAALHLAEQQQARMAQRLTVVNHLIADGAATQAERGQAQGQLDAARSEVLRAQADVFDARTASSRLALERLALDTPQARPATLATAVLAPTAGKVVRTFAGSQEWVAQGADLLLLQGQGEPEIHVFINPADQGNARVGQHADLRFLDGGRLGATVVRLESETSRTPPERVGPLATRLQSIVAVLRPDQSLPQKYRIGDLPLDVRFQRIGL